MESNTPAAAKTAATCPFGCCRPLPVIQGKRRIACDKCWQTIPLAVRSNLYNAGADVGKRRAAIRVILELAKAAKDSREGTSGVQTLLPL